MAIRASFRLLLASFVGILTPIAIPPAYAESKSPSPDFLEVSVPSPRADEFTRPTPALDTKTEEPSSPNDPSVWVPDDFDPWAYAFAESSRLQARSVRFVKAPPYSVAMNSQVKYFVDRFTTSDAGPSRMLLGLSPAGFERFFEEMGEPAGSLTLPPAGPPDMEKLLGLAKKYNAEILIPATT